MINKFVESTISEPIEASENYRDGKFYNAAPREEPSFGKLLEIAKRWYTEEKVDSQPAKPLPLLPVTRSQLDELSDDDLHNSDVQSCLKSLDESIHKKIGNYTKSVVTGVEVVRVILIKIFL